jgi:ubiquinone/menaquinone biosynthesis C-methylase UbiE
MAVMSTDPSGGTDLVALLDRAENLPAVTALRTLSYQRLATAEGSRVVDVGCGTGRAVAELTDQGVHAIGLDPDETMIATARHRWPRATFRIGDAGALPFGDGELHGYRADKVLHELADPAAALAEAHRVLAPGGRIVLLGQDWDAFIIDSDEPVLTRTIVHARADTITNPHAARRYRNLLREADFSEVTVEVYVGVFTDHTMLPMVTGLADAALDAGAITSEQAASWTAEQSRRAEADRIFLAVPLIVAAARR